MEARRIRIVSEGRAMKEFILSKCLSQGNSRVVILVHDTIVIQ